MEIFPSEYQQLDLNRYEKVFVRHACNDDEYGVAGGLRRTSARRGARRAARGQRRRPTGPPARR